MRCTMDMTKQQRAPFVEALEAYCAQHMKAYHTPGHKLGQGISDYQRRLFGDALRRDLGVMYALDDLFQPEGPLKEAMDLAADLYGAGRTFFSINGTTACIEAMILAVCADGDEIVIPREAHKSVINGLVLSGAVPVYMESRFDAARQVSLGPDLESLKAAVAAHPAAKAVLFTYPTYDGIAGNLQALTAYAHEKGLYVLVDEAHGAHFGFHPDLPAEALACGVDCVAQSTHKLAGSLTQTSMLHCRRDFPLTERVAASMNIVQSTSPHYWFLASLDSARQQLALEGREIIGRALNLARQVRKELNQILGITVFGRDIIDGHSVCGFDETKITIDFSGLGLDGVTAERELRREGIEVELVAGNHVLALITLGDTAATAEALVTACAHIAAHHEGAPLQQAGEELPLPQPHVVMAPRRAWNLPREAVPLEAALGRTAAENVTFYPPGIPVLSLGEEITADCLDYIRSKMAAGYKPNGPADGTLATLRVLKEVSHER